MFVMIRDERQGETEAIAQLIERAFRNAAHTNHQESYIVERLRQDKELTLAMLVEIDNNIVGYGVISSVFISDGTKNWYGLGPVAIDPAFQGQGLGTKLINRLLDRLRALRAGGCVVLGEPAYYRRFGFKAEKNLILADVPPQYFLALPFDNTIPEGQVHYHKAFTL